LDCKKFRRQRGEVDGFAVLLILAIFGLGSYFSVTHYRSELSGSDYQSLQRLASESCAGKDYLKQRVAAGPIIQWNKGDVEDKLKELANAQAANVAKAQILNTSVVCAQPDVNTKQ
jgi:hypothetical protein